MDKQNSQDGGNIDVSLPAKRDRKSDLPFVEVSDDSLVSLTGRELSKGAEINQKSVEGLVLVEEGLWNVPLPRTMPSSNPRG